MHTCRVALRKCPQIPPYSLYLLKPIYNITHLNSVGIFEKDSLRGLIGFQVILDNS